MKILCVEDDVDIATLLDNVLSANGHVVTSCHNGAEALPLILQGEFNLIFLDLQMPEVSGKDVIDSLEKDGQLSLNNIVILTANDLEEAEIREFEKKGITDILQKPMTLEGILEVVKKYN